MTSELFNYAKVALYSLPKVSLMMHSYAMFVIGLETKGLQSFMKFNMRDVTTFTSSKISLQGMSIIIMLKSTISDVYSHEYMKNKINSDDDLPLNHAS